MGKIAIYSRKSKFTEKGESINNQIEMCKEEIKKDYPDFKDSDIEIYEDEGFSGGNTDRPEFQKMKNNIEDGNISVVVCYRLDRISRSVGDVANLVKLFEEKSVKFISISENFDTTNPMGKAMLNVSSVFAQLERETISERLKDNLHELAKTGRWLGGNTPLGYKSIKVSYANENGRTKNYHKLELIQSEVEIVKTIFSKYIELKSQTGVEYYLMKNNIKTRSRNRIF